MSLTKSLIYFDVEFQYYSKILQYFVPLLPIRKRYAITPWIHKLFSPECSVTELQLNRNRLLIMLCLSLLNERIIEPIFFEPPPFNIVQNIDQHIQANYNSKSKTEPAPPRWELDTTWQELNESNNIFKTEPTTTEIKCAYHTTENLVDCMNRNKKDKNELEHQKSLGIKLDINFQFYLYLIKPYLSLLRNAEDRKKAIQWLQHLCNINKQQSCVFGKAVRNDYMALFIGYISNQQLIGPFQYYPIGNGTITNSDNDQNGNNNNNNNNTVTNPLPLIQHFKNLPNENGNNNNNNILDPTHPRVEQFINEMPQIDEGAFAFIALTGDLYEK